jgi:hypothetical protein
VPDPIVSRADETDPEHQALLADSVGLALLVVLQTVAPAERLAFVLHDMFAMPFDEIAPIVGRSPALTFARLSPFVRPALVNGVAGVVVAPGGRPFSVMAFTVRDGRIVEIDALAAPSAYASST